LHPHLFINGRFLTQQVSGVQSFARSLCRELASEAPFTLLVPPGTDTNDPVFGNRMEETGYYRGHLWEQTALPLHMLPQRDALLLNLCNTAPLSLANQAVTIHDLAFLRHPEWFHPLFSRYYSFAIPRLLKKSRIIITVSETIRREICGHFDIDPKRIHLIGNKADDELLGSEPAPSVHRGIRPGNFFLMVGSNNPRKNFGVAERLFDADTSLPVLVISGGNHKSFRATKPAGNQDTVIHTGYTGYGELRWLYENAIGYINPSLYEGFGLTNLEAMAFGCPVLCSDLPVFREVCGDAPYYFDSGSPASLKAAIDLLLGDAELRKRKTSSGKSIFTTFQQKNRAAALLNILHS
jgi:glycosyltransferase involved in cell wall biosynthesis